MNKFRMNLNKASKRPTMKTMIETNIVSPIHFFNFFLEDSLFNTFSYRYILEYEIVNKARTILRGIKNTK